MLGFAIAIKKYSDFVFAIDEATSWHSLIWYWVTRVFMFRCLWWIYLNPENCVGVEKWEAFKWWICLIISLLIQHFVDNNVNIVLNPGGIFDSITGKPPIKLFDDEVIKYLSNPSLMITLHNNKLPNDRMSNGEWSWFHWITIYLLYGTQIACCIVCNGTQIGCNIAQFKLNPFSNSKT